MTALIAYERHLISNNDHRAIGPELAAVDRCPDRIRALRLIVMIPYAVAAVAEAVVRSEAADAATVLPTLINSIEDTQARSKASRTIMLRMMRSDKESARQLLERLIIGEDEKEVYRQTMLSQDD